LDDTKAGYERINDGTEGYTLDLSSAYLCGFGSIFFNLLRSVRFLRMGADTPSFTLTIAPNTRSTTLTEKILHSMASPILYTPVFTEDDSSSLLYDKEASSDDKSTECTVIRRRTKLTILHWIAHSINLAVILVLAIRVWTSEPLQSRCHKLFNYYCMTSYGLSSIVHRLQLTHLPQQLP
jgi:hypothetical protein